MNVDRRMLWIVTKWIIYAVLFYYLWQIKFFVFLFVWIPHLITYLVGLMFDYGLVPVLRYYAFWWFMAIVGLIVLAIVTYSTIYRAKRRDFVVGGEFEGRVVWVKGIRQGLLYDLWDAKNWISWKIGKKKGSDSKIPISSNGVAKRNGTDQPDPWDIPIGPDDREHYIFYIRRWWPVPPFAWPERWFIPRSVKVSPAVRNIFIDHVDVERSPHPTVPGRFDYYVASARPRSQFTNTKVSTVRNRRLLKRSGEFVEHAVSSDSETKKSDWVQGSFDVPQLREEEGAYDD